MLVLLLLFIKITVAKTSDQKLKTTMVLKESVFLLGKIYHHQQWELLIRLASI